MYGGGKMCNVRRGPLVEVSAVFQTRLMVTAHTGTLRARHCSKGFASIISINPPCFPSPHF